MTPTEAIESISSAYPELHRVTSKTRSSFFLPDRGSSGRVVRIAHSGQRPLKLAASSLRARHRNESDGSAFERVLPATGKQLHTIVEEEMRIAQSAALTNWEKVLTSLASLGVPATISELKEQVLKDFPDFVDLDDVRKDMIMLSVNDPKRRAYRAHNTMNRGGRSEQYLDRVYRLEKAGEVAYELYDPSNHGVWIGRIIDGQWTLVRTEPTVGGLVDHPDFDPESSAGLTKKKIAAQVAARRGQTKFRKELLAAYGGRCCISGCAIERLLEAAHITPHVNEKTDVLPNGLLLRADLHTLFDLGWLRVHPETLVVDVHPSARSDETYLKVHGMPLRKANGHSPSVKALQAHYEENAHHWPIDA